MTGDTFPGFTFSKPFNTSSTRVSILCLLKPAAAEKPRHGIDIWARGAVNARPGRVKLRAVKRMKDMVTFLQRIRVVLQNSELD